ncbi:MAG: site-specific integrase [Terriglobales bacterium]|jgi:integrase
MRLVDEHVSIEKKKAIMTRSRGTGSIFKQPGCKTWTIKYSAYGRTVREATGETDWGTAQKQLTQRLHEIDTGRFVAPEVRRITVSDLAEDFLRDYRINGKKSTSHAERRWKLHLEPFFGQCRVGQVTNSLIGKYIDHRMTEGAKNGNINRELAALKRMFRLGHQAQKISWLPPFPRRLAENNVRTGFVDDKQFALLTASTSELWLRAFLEIAYTYGWRKRELLNLRVRQVDILGHSLRLDAGTTKNDDGREVALSPTALTLLQQCIQGKKPEDHVFTRAGKPVRDFRKAWEKLTTAAGVPGLLLHDLRRSAARNLRNAGVPEGVIMKIGGWRTRSVFERYSIIVQSDIQDAMGKLEAQRVQQAEQARLQKQQGGQDELSHDWVMIERKGEDSPTLIKELNNNKLN